MNLSHSASNITHTEVDVCFSIIAALSCNFDDAQPDSMVFPCRCDGNQCQLEDVSTYTYTWITHKGPTPSSFTGPNDDHTLQNGNGLYVYAEASDQTPGSTALLRTPVFSLGTTSCLTFFYHMYGQHIGSLNVTASFTNGSSRTVYSLQGEQGGMAVLGEVEAMRYSPVTDRLSLVGVGGGLTYYHLLQLHAVCI